MLDGCSQDGFGVTCENLFLCFSGPMVDDSEPHSSRWDVLLGIRTGFAGDGQCQRRAEQCGSAVCHDPSSVLADDWAVRNMKNGMLDRSGICDDPATKPGTGVRRLS